MRNLSLVLLLAAISLTGPAEAYKLHSGTGGAAGIATSNLPTLAKGISSQSQPSWFNFPGDCAVTYPDRVGPGHYHAPPQASDPAVAPCAN